MKNVVLALFVATIGLDFAGCSGDGETLLGSSANETSVSPSAKKLALGTPGQANVLLQVTESNGTPASGLDVSFSRAVSGRGTGDARTSITDSKGQATISIQTAGATGYYTA